MTTADDFISNGEDESTTNDDSESSTYVEFGEHSHPDAYEVISGGSDMRDAAQPRQSLRQVMKSEKANVDDLMAPITVLFVDAYIHETAKDDYMAFVNPEPSDVIDLCVSDETDFDFQAVYDEFKDRFGSDGDDNDD